MTEKEYNDTFDVFEYFLALNFWHLVGDKFGGWAPVGQFQWRKNTLRTNAYLLNDILMEADQLKSNWEVLKSGMFEGKYEVFIEIKSKVDSFLKTIYFH